MLLSLTGEKAHGGVLIATRKYLPSYQMTFERASDLQVVLVRIKAGMHTWVRSFKIVSRAVIYTADDGRKSGKMREISGAFNY